MISSRFEELERRCKSIKRRKIAKIILFIILISFIFVAIYFLAKGNYLGLHKEITIKKEHPKSIKIENKKENYQKKIHNIQEQNNTPSLKLEPMINIPKLNEKTVDKDVVKAKKVIAAKPKTDKSMIKKEVKSVKKEKKPLLTITTTVTDTKTILLKNFTVKKDYSSALKLAEYFLKKEDFTKALYWAKIANKLDSTKDSSWIIYAKAKYALGEKEDAIESLKTFLNIFYSKNIDKLLQKYTKEKK